MAKHVAHHKHVAVFIVHANPIHPQELGQQRAAMALHNVLGWKGGSNGVRLSSRYTNSPGMDSQTLLFQSGQKTSRKEVTRRSKVVRAF